MFGVQPKELDARLGLIDVETCGSVVFGRFRASEAGKTLQEYLGDGFAILQAMTDVESVPRSVTLPISANWKLGYHISLDDYHLVAVHPDTFGKSGYLSPDAVRYHRFGLHSAYFHGTDESGVLEMAEACRDGTYRPTAYRIFQFFPNLLASHLEGARNWFVILQQYVPIAVDRTVLRTWYFPAPFPTAGRGAIHGLLRRMAKPWLPLVIRRYIRKISREDNGICEQIQTTASQIEGRPILGRHEERIAWFQEVHQEWTEDGPLVPHRNRTQDLSVEQDAEGSSAG